MEIKRLSDIHLRDPFVLTDKNENKYYLYGTLGGNVWEGPAIGFDVYVSSDLQEWAGPIPAFRPEPDFWADRHFWAPEVYRLGERYYMFASFKAEGLCRGTGILTAQSPEGPFHSMGLPLTPPDWECLDGTLFVDEAGAPWTKGFGDSGENYVTDGPFLHRLPNGELLMLWSSHGEQGYALGVARSASGEIVGPWTHDPLPLFAKDGGHGMLFQTFSGQLMLTIHAPNDVPNERPVLFLAEEDGGRLTIEKRD